MEQVDIVVKVLGFMLVLFVIVLIMFASGVPFETFHAKCLKETFTANKDTDVKADKSKTPEKTNSSSPSGSYSIEAQKAVLEYLNRNPKCRDRILNRDKPFYLDFERAFEYHMATEFQRKLGYVPEKSSVETMNDREALAFIAIYHEMPPCDELIEKYIRPKKVSKDNSDSTRSHTYKPSEEPKLQAESTPLYAFFETITKQMATLTKAIEQGLLTKTGVIPSPISSPIDTKSVPVVTISTIAETTGQKPAIGVVQEEKPRTDADQLTVENPFKKLRTKPFGNQENIASNFSYQPEYTVSHMQPTSAIYGAYGWSYMPPQSWSVPQKRPPACIPSKGTQATVTAIYDQSVPKDALDWTQVGSILPKFEYKEEYNPNYYHPGYVSQDMSSYPFTEKHTKKEYYSYNLAQAVEKPKPIH